ncbi:hypothetical protein RhiJN_16202 [Ceratobasidium sp. AG-Ba]|nr:hypothetical protein RhiJN_16202 [Ceratobasidium sp. AG-Ba]
MRSVESYIWVEGEPDGVETGFETQASISHEDADLPRCANEKGLLDSQSGPAQEHTKLPPEIWDSIVDHAMYGPLQAAYPRTLSLVHKRRLSTIVGLANASKAFRAIVLQCWARQINQKLPDDPVFLEKLGKTNKLNIFLITKRLSYMDTFEIYRAAPSALEKFGLLEELTIDGHSDIDFGCPTGGSNSGPTTTGADGQDNVAEHEYDDTEAQAEDITARMSYRKLKVRLPATLRALRIYNSHVPDIYFIHKVVGECPHLQSLTLARCTMFTRPDCEFWARLPGNESDSYFSNQGIETYAAAVGKELSKIPELQEVCIGIYLTDHQAIATHLHQHYAGNPNGAWDEPCPQCALAYQEQTEAAEKKASLILASSVPKLSLVSWQSFFTRGRTGWHSCSVNADHK